MSEVSLPTQLRYRKKKKKTTGLVHYSSTLFMSEVSLPTQLRYRKKKKKTMYSIFFQRGRKNRRNVEISTNVNEILAILYA